MGRREKDSQSGGQETRKPSYQVRGDLEDQGPLGSLQNVNRVRLWISFWDCLLVLIWGRFNPSIQMNIEMYKMQIREVPKKKHLVQIEHSVNVSCCDSLYIYI